MSVVASSTTTAGWPRAASACARRPATRGGTSASGPYQTSRAGRCSTRRCGRNRASSRANSSAESWLGATTKQGADSQGSCARSPAVRNGWTKLGAVRPVGRGATVAGWRSAGVERSPSPTATRKAGSSRSRSVRRGTAAAPTRGARRRACAEPVPGLVPPGSRSLSPGGGAPAGSGTRVGPGSFAGGRAAADAPPPAASHSSTRSAPFSTSWLTSQSGSTKGLSRKSARGTREPAGGRPTPRRARQKSRLPSTFSMERRSVVPAKPLPLLQAHLAEGQLHLVVDGQDARHGDAVEAGGLAHGLAREVHVGLRHEQQHALPGDAPLHHQPLELGAEDCPGRGDARVRRPP